MNHNTLAPWTVALAPLSAAASSPASSPASETPLPMPAAAQTPDPWEALSQAPDPQAGAAWLDAAAPAPAPAPAVTATDPETVSSLVHSLGDSLHQFLNGTVPVESWINTGLSWVVAHGRPYFQAVRMPIDGTLQAVQSLLTQLPAVAMVTLIGLLAWQFAGRRLALGTSAALLIVAALGIWPEAMVTLSLVLTSLLFCLLIGLPLGILLASSERAERVMRPLLDAMQTTPAFVYLVPVVMLFGIGNVPGVIVTIVFALAPLARLTNLGLRQVRPDLIEAARAYGASPLQMLWKVKLPLAMPSIMAGINQALMLSLSMVVIASMIAVGGLGQMVLRGIGRLDMGLATVGGLGIVILAITLDRLTQALGRPARAGRGRWWQRGPVGLLLNGLPRRTRQGSPMEAALVASVLVLFLCTSALAQPPALPGKGITVQPLKSSLAEETFQTLLVSRALEQLGYTVLPMKDLEPATEHLAIANGDATFMATHWRLLHADFYRNSGGDARMVRFGPYAQGAVQGYLIDRQTAEAHHITRLDQLRDPALARLFDTDGDGRADLTGCNPGWGCEGEIEHQLDAYQLRSTVTHRQGSYTALMADTLARFKQGQPILYYTWTPYWVSAVLRPGTDVVWLQVPFSAAKDGKTNTRQPNGKNYGFAADQQEIVANRQFIERNPAAARLFELMRLPMADINAQNQRMNEGAHSERDIARHTDGWIRVHQQQFDGWIAQARAAADGQAAQSPSSSLRAYTASTMRSE
ncbi:glycine betaine/L-proline ABC transporter substrate-binding protein ProX [Roseateles sp. SL47]|uniref:glycine betaine/L-proline ABC transporter substrate-binding protein ProX n=1 Tax=Roseateles sp. SL47 TaxID=2995138 RepID=UPI003B63B245